MNFYEKLIKIKNKRLYNLFKKYSKTQWLSKEELENLQYKRTKKIIEYAYNNFSFYNKKYKQKKITPNDFKKLTDIEKFPLISVAELKQALAKEEFKNYSKEPVEYLSTTGSTGTPFVFPINKTAQLKRAAFTFRTYEWYGQFFGVKNILFWRTQSQSWKSTFKERFFFGTHRLSIYDDNDVEGSLINDDKLNYFINQIKKYKPKVIDSYVSFLTLLSDFIIRNNINNLKIDAVVTGAEYLSPYSRKIIKKAFGCPVFNRYGGTEIGLMAHQCSKSENEELHIMSDKLLFELICNEKAVSPGKIGEVVITDFTNYALPFIRLRIGDTAVFENFEKKCSCGRAFPLLKKVDGRINDLFILPSGKILVSHVWHKIFREEKDIKEFKIVQKEKDYFIVYLVLENKEHNISNVKQRVENFLPKCKVQWQIVDRIKPGKGGKFRHSVSEVPFSLNQIRSEFISPAYNIGNIAPYKAVKSSAYNYRNTALKLDWNEGSILPPTNVIKKIEQKINEKNFLNWYPNLDQTKLKHSIANFVKIDAKNIEIFNGSDGALDYIARTFLEKDDIAVIVGPTYDQFRICLEAQGVSYKYVFGKDPFDLKIDEIISQISYRSKLIYIVNPNNPTGFLWHSKDIEKLAKAFPNTIIVLDEAYIEFCKENSSVFLINKYSNLFVLRTFSKAFCLASLRIGYLIANSYYLDLINRIKNLKEVNAIAQVAAHEALKNWSEYKKYIKEVNYAKKYFKAKLEQINIKTKGQEGNFLLLKIANTEKFINFLADNKIYVRDRSYLNQLKDYVRITIGNKKQMEILINIINKYFKK